MANAPDEELVGLYRALGDGTRLRILHRLATGSASVGQISGELQLAKSTVHEHLTSLRAAGLVKSVAGDGFRLEPELPDLNALLKEFLGLEMRRECEKCHTLLTTTGIAFICSYECTYCERCGDALGYKCLNCGGELTRRPRRAKLRRPADAAVR